MGVRDVGDRRHGRGRALHVKVRGHHRVGVSPAVPLPTYTYSQPTLIMHCQGRGRTDHDGRQVDWRVPAGYEPRVEIVHRARE